jgi:hypothetical protein
VFVQVIRGPVEDRQAARAAIDRWAQELGPVASGWLGTTAGVTADGELVLAARFDSEAAARANSARPEQDAWWRETSRLFTAKPTFLDSTEIDVQLSGDPDKAGFVQVMTGRTSDPQRSREIMQEAFAGDRADAWAAYRPDTIGSLIATYADNSYTSVMYFTSEAEAREGEKRQPPPELVALMEPMMALEQEEPTFADLTEPWLYGPR